MCYIAATCSTHEQQCVQTTKDLLNGIHNGGLTWQSTSKGRSPHCMQKLTWHHSRSCCVLRDALCSAAINAGSCRCCKLHQSVSHDVTFSPENRSGISRTSVNCLTISGVTLTRSFWCLVTSCCRICMPITMINIHPHPACCQIAEGQNCTSSGNAVHVLQQCRGQQQIEGLPQQFLNVSRASKSGACELACGKVRGREDSSSLPL